MTAFMALAESHPALAYLAQGGPVLWLIAGLSVVTLALILAILARLSDGGSGRRGSPLPRLPPGSRATAPARAPR
jgi:amino acid transporter